MIQLSCTTFAMVTLAKQGGIGRTDYEQKC